MNQLLTKAIILTRTDYGEADKIITLLTPQVGKLRLMAKGVRKIKSRLAGGVELFSVSDITYLTGKGEIGTLISARLDQHFGNIIQDINRVQLGYDLIKLLNKATEDNPEEAYFTLMLEMFTALNDDRIPTELIRIWFEAQLLAQAGYEPNLYTDSSDTRLNAEASYNFDFDSMTFAAHQQGHFTANHIKTLRLLFSKHLPDAIGQVEGAAALLPDLSALIRTMLTSYIRI